MLRFHHSRPLAGVSFGEVVSERGHAEDYLKAYEWLEREVGFYPLFLAVGSAPVDIYMTGYQDNWRSLVSTQYVEGRRTSTLRKKGEFSNEVLFSFDDIDGVFMDYHMWHIVLNASWRNGMVTDWEKRMIFRRSWSKATWLRYATQSPHSVQLVVPKLSLPSAERVWVRNRATKVAIEKMGFNNVSVTRIPVEHKY